MKKRLCLTVVCLFQFFLLVSSSTMYSQVDTSSIYKQSRHIRKKFCKHPTVLAAKLTKELEDDASKVLAISYWITKNIKYDFAAYLSNTLNRHSNEQILRRRVALCSEYVSLFNEMCESVGIKSESISGYVHDFDFFPGDTLYRSEHAWSTVLVDDHWELMDLTFGAGHIAPKKQWFKKMLWVLFEKPYEVEWEYVHAYNPEWFNVPPSEMLMTHFPTLDFFQFLENPISMEDFNQGMNFIYNQFRNEKVVNTTTPEIKAYLAMGENARLRLEMDHTKRINPLDNRLLGFNTYLLLNNAFDANYNVAERKLSATKKQKTKMNSLYTYASENFQQSIQNNRDEYEHYERRSNAWLDTLKVRDKAFTKNINQRIRANKKQISAIKSIGRISNLKSKGISKSKKAFDRIKMNRVRRPDEGKSNIFLAKQYLNHKDTLRELIDQQMSKIDSIFKIYSKTDQSFTASTEQTAFKLHLENKNELRKNNLSKKLAYAFIYFDDEAVEKEWFKNRYQQANQINEENLMKMLITLKENIYTLNLQLKSHRGMYKQAINDLKLTKKNSSQDLNEINQFKELKEHYQSQMDSISTAYHQYLSVRDKVNFLLKWSNKNLANTKKLLKKDMLMEKQRHKNYMFYRKSIQDSENFNMKFLIKEMDKMSKYFIEDDKGVMAKKTSKSGKYSEWGQPSGNENVPSSNLYEEQLFVDILNEARKKKGMKPLVIDEDLCRAARYHSYDMGVQHYFEHATYDRNLVSGRPEFVCKTFERTKFFASASGENIAAGNSTAEKTYWQWYHSPGHHRNMFNPKWSRIGVGYVKIEGSPYVHYWTTDFGY